MNRSIYLDDNRKPRNPQDYTDTARNYTEFRLLLEGIVAAGDKVEFVDFDYILSDFPDPNWPFPHEKNGYHSSWTFHFAYQRMYPSQRDGYSDHFVRFKSPSDTMRIRLSL